MPELFFKTPKEFNVWLEINHQLEQELWLCYYKKHTKKLSITWEESVEEALCFGWIDGLRKSRDEESYMIRFTPRRKTSIWSPTNLSTIKKLIKEKRIREPGLAIYNQRKPDHEQPYENMKKDFELDKEYKERLKGHKIAWKYFQNLPAGYKKQAIRWIMTAKQASTRDRRFKKFYQHCTKEERMTN